MGPRFTAPYSVSRLGDPGPLKAAHLHLHTHMPPFTMQVVRGSGVNHLCNNNNNDDDIQSTIIVMAAAVADAGASDENEKDKEDKEDCCV